MSSDLNLAKSKISLTCAGQTNFGVSQIYIAIIPWNGTKDEFYYYYYIVNYPTSYMQLY